MNDFRMKEFFNKLQDDESRMIFKHRLLFYLDGNWKHVINMIDELNGFEPILTKKYMPEWDGLLNFIEKYKKCPAQIVAYGAGQWAEHTLSLLKAKELITT
ncbi:MAG: hypothetical protein LBH25_06955 [Fibromonadaceae bacterium]|jgi:hypothetical protein|nr:hypothetical protein [Fibromonadaceae bacterium]